MNNIFISIACFMDKDIINTIDDCLKKAQNPKNIVFGICLQHDPDDDFLQNYDNNPQFRIHKMHWNEAKGPSYARGIIYDLFDNEDYFFQIDCHTRFFDKWDSKIIESFNLCKKINTRSIISHYPVNINNMNDNLSTIINISTVRCIDINHGIKTHGRYVLLKDCPKKSWGTSAAMLFFDKQAYKDIPYDKEIYNGLQFEEQVVIAARYWTYGYDIFTPSQHIISTEYLTNRYRQKFNPPTDSNRKRETYNRLCHIMKLKYNEKYLNLHDGYLGNERTIEDYYKMLNIYDKIKEVFPNNNLNFTCIGENIVNHNIIHSVIINLKNDPAKYKTISAKLKEYNMPHKRFDAIVGQNVYHQLKINNKFNTHKFNFKQIGCWQSHYKIWEKMVENNIDKLLIFEDDCQFVNGFKKLYDKTIEMSKNVKYDILFIGYCGANIDKINDLHLVNSGKPRCTHSYIITLNCAKIFLKKFETINFPIDELIGDMFYKKKNNWIKNIICIMLSTLVFNKKIFSR